MNVVHCNGSFMKLKSPQLTGNGLISCQKLLKRSQFLSQNNILWKEFKNFAEKLPIVLKFGLSTSDKSEMAASDSRDSGQKPQKRTVVIW